MDYKYIADVNKMKRCKVYQYHSVARSIKSTYKLLDSKSAFQLSMGKFN